MKLINVFLKKEISLLKKERERRKVKILFKYFMCNPSAIIFIDTS